MTRMISFLGAESLASIEFGVLPCNEKTEKKKIKPKNDKIAGILVNHSWGTSSSRIILPS